MPGHVEKLNVRESRAVRTALDDIFKLKMISNDDRILKDI
jgi:hypothetical protein